MRGLSNDTTFKSVIGIVILIIAIILLIFLFGNSGFSGVLVDNFLNSINFIKNILGTS